MLYKPGEAFAMTVSAPLAIGAMIMAYRIECYMSLFEVANAWGKPEKELRKAEDGKIAPIDKQSLVDGIKKTFGKTEADIRSFNPETDGIDIFTDNKLGQFVVMMRRRMGKTQKNLAQKWCVSCVTVHNLEKGIYSESRFRRDATLLKTLCDFFDTTPQEISDIPIEYIELELQRLNSKTRPYNRRKKSAPEMHAA